MNVYLDEKDIGQGKLTKKYMEGSYKWIFVNDKKEWQVKSLKEYKQKVVEEICFEISSAIAYEVLINVNDTKILLTDMQNIINNAIKNVKENKYGLR